MICWLIWNRRSAQSRYYSFRWRPQHIEVMHFIRQFFCLSLVILGVGAHAQQELPSLLPDFTVYDMQDQAFTPADMPTEGRLVVIFYDPGCGYCQKEAVAIGENYERFKHASLYFVAMQDKPLIEEFIQKYGTLLQDKPNVRFLRDANYEFIDKFNPREYPSTYVFSAANRRLVRYLSGDTPIGVLISVASP